MDSSAWNNKPPGSCGALSARSSHSVGAQSQPQSPFFFEVVTMMSLKEYADINQACLADYLPWAMIVGPGIVEHKDGALQKTFCFRGHDLDSSTPQEPA